MRHGLRAVLWLGRADVRTSFLTSSCGLPAPEIVGSAVSDGSRYNGRLGAEAERCMC
jgi:hypothetical protein